MKVELVSYTKIADSYMENMDLDNEPGADDMIAFLARISSGKEMSDRFENTEKLLKYCYKHGHWSIFDMVDVTFYLETSIVISKQILRHYSFRFQEISRRYQSEGIEFEPVEFRRAGKTNRQVGDEIVDPILEGGIQSSYYVDNIMMRNAMQVYNQLIREGVASETARMILPQCTTTSMYMKGSIRSWMSFLNQRLSDHAQKEIRLLAVEIANKLDKIVPKISDCTNQWGEYKGGFM